MAGVSVCTRGLSSRAEFLGIYETGEEMVLPFSPVPCSNTCSFRERANAEPDIAFQQNGLALCGGTTVLQELLGSLLSLYMAGGHCLVCVVAEQDNYPFMTECFMLSHGEICFSGVGN